MRADIIRRPVLWALLSGVGVLSLLASIVYVDRPAADFAHTAFGTPLFRIAVAILTTLHVLLVPMVLFAVGCGAWRLAGRRLPGWAGPWLLATLAAGVALVVAVLLKIAIGRSQAYPLYVSNHIHEFRPFQGDAGHKAFPSATMAVATAFLAVLCLESAGRRWFAGTVLTLVAACIVITNGHWIADILGGFYLGTIAGWVILRASLRPASR